MLKPMRILHIGKYYPPFAGGMENFLLDLMGASHRRGMEVAALVHRHESPGRHQPAPAIRWPVYRAPILGRIFHAPLSPSFPFMLDRALREFQPDLLHLHLPNLSAFWALALPRARRLPWVMHWHADATGVDARGTPRLARRTYGRLEQRLLGKAAAIIATSTPYLQASRALDPWRERCVTIPLGLDVERLGDPVPAQLDAAEALWGGSGFRVLAIGRLSYYKGFDNLIRAVAGVPEALLLISGEGEQRSSLLELRRSLGVEDRVMLPGYQNQSALSALLASCDMLCLPSLDRAEAFGLVLLEAMRFARPVIVSDIDGSGTGWVVGQSGHGLLIPPGDPDALMAALRRLGGDAALRERLGAAGAASLTARFGIDAVAAEVLEVYDGVLDTGTRGLHPSGSRCPDVRGQACGR